MFIIPFKLIACGSASWCRQCRCFASRSRGGLRGHLFRVHRLRVLELFSFGALGIVDLLRRRSIIPPVVQVAAYGGQQDLNDVRRVLELDLGRFAQRADLVQHMFQ